MIRSQDIKQAKNCGHYIIKEGRITSLVPFDNMLEKNSDELKILRVNGLAFGKRFTFVLITYS